MAVPSKLMQTVCSGKSLSFKRSEYSSSVELGNENNQTPFRYCYVWQILQNQRSKHIKKNCSMHEFKNLRAKILPDPTSLPPPMVNPNSLFLPRFKLIRTKSQLDSWEAFLIFAVSL